LNTESHYTSYNLDHLGLIAGKVDEPDLPELIDTVVEQDHEQRQFPVGLCVKAILLIGFGFVNQVLYLILHFFRYKQVEHLNDDALGECAGCDIRTPKARKRYAERSQNT